MNHNPRVNSIKRAQKEKLLLKEVSVLFFDLAKEHPELHALTPTRAELSADKSMLHIYFYSAQGKDHYNQLLELLKLYRPSMRSILAQKSSSRYVPDIRFHFDEKYVKQERFEKIMEKIKTST
jgi:ribosome-binding factor A